MSEIYIPAALRRWPDHFRWQETLIQGLTPEGRATVFLLRLNLSERLAERRQLLARRHFLPFMR